MDRVERPRAGLLRRGRTSGAGCAPGGWLSPGQPGDLEETTTWAASLNRQRRAEVAQRRFLAAVRTLETARRLAVPMIQVNVGAQQVNVGNLAVETK